MLSRPHPEDFSTFQAGYISLCPDDIMPFLVKQTAQFKSFILSLDEEKLQHRYMPEKWSLREVIVHIIDTEMIFDYRCLAILRGEQTSLPGFDQDQYIRIGNFDHLDKNYLHKTFESIRNYTLCLFEGFQDKDWLKKGEISNYSMRLNAMPYMLAGHVQHHMNVINARYL